MKMSSTQGTLPQAECYPLVELFNAGRYAELEERTRLLIEEFPDSGFAWKLLGASLQAQGKEALTAKQKATELLSDDAEVYNDLGAALHALGRLDEAEASYRRTLKIKPDNADALSNLGATLKGLGQIESAVASYRQALSIKPDFADAHYNLGIALQARGRLDEAVASYRRALAIKPDFAEAHSNLGNILKDRGQFDDAMASYRKALLIAPDFAEAHGSLGNALKDLGQLDNAIVSFGRALAIKLDLAEAHNNLGNTLKDLGQLDDAVASYRRALAIKPDYDMAHSNLIFTLDLSPGCDLATLQQERTVWDSIHGAPLAALHLPHANRPNPLRRLRIGYVSADFKTHSAAYAFGALLLKFDPASFEVFAYSNSTTEDALTRVFQQGVSHWRNIVGLSDAAVADLIRQDEIDILVDLSGHSAGNRLLVFARKPAPIQVTAWGYAASTGLRAMDVFFADPIVVPPDEQHFYAEEIRYLPCVVGHYFPNEFPPVTPLPALSAGHITFGSFNRLAKISDEAYRLWAQILLAVPDSRLVLKSGDLNDAGVQARTLQHFTQAGVDAARITLLGKTSWGEHVAAFNQIDIALDPFPQGGGVTTLEGLKMGVPVVTRCWPTIPGRVSASILTTLGLAGWIAESTEQYLEIAQLMGQDIAALATLRLQLRPRFTASIIGDPQAYVRAVELEYRTLWQRWCENADRLEKVDHTSQPQATTGGASLSKLLKAARTSSGARKGKTTQKRKSTQGISPRQKSLPQADIDRLAALFNAGSYVELETRTRALVERYPDSGFAWKALGAALQAQGKPALAPKQKAAELLPDDAEAQYNLGNLFRELDQLDNAVASYRRALEINADYAEAQGNLGYLLRELGQFDDAVASCRRALTINPALIEAHCNLGSALQALGQVEEATLSYYRALAINADYAEAHYDLGTVQQALGKLDFAVASYHRALEISPNFASAYCNLGVALKALGQLDDAAGNTRRALAIKPDFAAAHSNLGAALKDLGRPDDAVASCQRALGIKPDFAEAHNNLGNALKDLGYVNNAVVSYRRAHQINPDYVEAQSNLGNALQALGLFAEAVTTYHRALEIKPDLAEAHSNIGTALQALGQLDHSVRSYRRALAIKPDVPVTHSNLIFTLDLSAEVSLTTLQQERTLWHAIHAAPLASLQRPHSNRPDPLRRLRIGYVSADFREHSAAVAFGAMLLKFDSADFEVFAYSNSTTEDGLTGAFQQGVSHWRKIVGKTDQTVAELIRQDQIDILVDLSGHSAGNRLLVFARKPAPIQITAWGYASSTGLRAMDVFFADPIVVPPDEQHFYAEEIRNLPCVVGHYSSRAFPSINPLPALSANSITFGSFNRLTKISPEAFGLWARILLAVGGSRLVLKTAELYDAEVRQGILKHFTEAGVDPSRITLLGKTSWADHVAAFNQVDIGLDPFPQGGGVTTLEGLMMGVPVVTRRWPSIPGRVSASILTTLGLSDWIAESPEQYVEIAQQMAHDLPALALLRQQLRPRFTASIIGDPQAYVRAVELEYRKLWQRWCAKTNSLLSPGATVLP